MRIPILMAATLLCSLDAARAGFQVRDTDGVVTVTAPAYRLDITKQGFRYGFCKPGGEPIAAPHAASGLEFSGGAAATAELKSQGPQRLAFDVVNYLGSACDTHRIEDFNFDQDQDRGPLNVLAFAYSGLPYAYPDILGGTFGEGRNMPPLGSPRMQRYMMRVAQFDAVNPSMAVGMGPWNFPGAEVGRVMLAAAQLHGRLHPYIYSAAVDAFETGFPWTMAPLPLVFPDDPQVYGRENTTVRGYEWMFGPSLLAAPLYGNDYATAERRDVYLPAGPWMDYDTGERHAGPKLLAGFALPPGKTPLFVGGKGVLVLRDLKDAPLHAKVYPLAAGGSTYRFTAADGTTRSKIVNDNTGWNAAALAVTDTTAGQPVTFEMEKKTGAIRFPLAPGHDYRLSGGGVP